MNLLWKVQIHECNTPRIPTSEFAAPIPLTYWVVRFECTTPQLTYECPHWYDGKWAAATWAPQGGIGGNFVKTRQLLNVAGSEALMTSSNLNTDSDAASIQYAMKCTDFSSSNENLQINLGVDFATTDSTPSHISRVFTITPFKIQRSSFCVIPFLQLS